VAECTGQHERRGTPGEGFGVGADVRLHLTGPISGVAQVYLAGLINETSDLLNSPTFKVNPPYFAAFFTIVVTLYFWRKNIIGMHESSKKALRIMQLTSVMVVILIGWCLVTILQRGYNPVPFPTMESSHVKDEASWLKGFPHPDGFLPC
jgi:hypothetical protein